MNDLDTLTITNANTTSTIMPTPPRWTPPGEAKRGEVIHKMNRDQLRHLLRTSPKQWERALASSLLR